MKEETTLMQAKESALRLYQYTIDFRRELHSHPEPSFEEFRTTERIAEELDKLSIPYTRFVPTGLIGEITGGKPGKTIALRADIDALSIQEKSGLPYGSQTKGMMHACGHDTHAAMLLTAARILQENRKSLCGRVKLIFQPAEEALAGAKKVISQGALDGVDAIFGIHIFAQLPAGSVNISSGTLLPSGDKFTIRVKGLACHGAMPERGMDATLASSAIVMNLQSVVSRELDPLNPAVLTVGSLNSGTRFNIVSGEATMEGTVRIFDSAARERMPEIIGRIARETAAAYRCTAEVNYEFLVSALQCDEELTTLVKASAAKVVAPDMLVPFMSSMGSEDFAEYTACIKGAFAGLGGGGEYPQHNDHFTIDENALPVGVALYVQTALDYLV